MDMLLTRVAAAEVEEMWSGVGKKQAPRWLGPALEYRTGKSLAYVFGRREDRAVLESKALRVPFGSTRFSTEDWGADTRHWDLAHHIGGKRNTQQHQFRMR